MRAFENQNFGGFMKGSVGKKQKKRISGDRLPSGSPHFRDSAFLENFACRIRNPGLNLESH